MSGNPPSHRQTAVMVTFLSLLACVTSLPKHIDVAIDTTSPFAAAYPDLYAIMEAEIPIRPGMTVDAVRQVAARSAAANSESPSVDGRHRSDRHFAFLLFAPNGTSDAVDSHSGSLTYLINGSVQCWIDIAITDGRVENIYAIPGNMSVMLRKVRWRGKGPHRGMFANMP